MKTTLLTLLLALGTALTAAAETTYFVKGETFENVDSPGGPGSLPFVPSPLTGLLIGDDLAGTLTGSIAVDTPDGIEVFPISAALAAPPTDAVPILGVPALATVASPATSSIPSGLDVWAGNFIDFERSPLDPFTMESLTTWDMLLGVFGAGPGQEDVRFGATMQLSETPFAEVPNPSTLILGVMAIGCFFAFGAASTRKPC